MPPKCARNQIKFPGRRKRQARGREEKSFPPWTELPDGITANILHRLGAIDILETAQKVCTTWRSVCKDPAMWRVIDMRNDGFSYDFRKMCRQAVDRSQGQLVEINLDYSADNALLHYIATRSGKLRRLYLACCSYLLSDEGLIEAIKGFPLLEELHVILTPFNDKTVETFGRSCPLLRSFAFEDPESDYYDDGCNEIAFSIARSMPELRHLQLLGNGLTDEGLEAILNGCPHLESLDIRFCYNVHLMGDLGKRLAAQIKCLRSPSDFTSNGEFQLDDCYL